MENEPEVWGEFSGNNNNNGDPIFWDFLTNPLCGIGSDSTDPASYVSYTFAHHAMASLPNGKYADAAAAQQYHYATGGAYWNPPFDWLFMGYWQTPPTRGLVQLPSPSNYLEFPTISMSGMLVI